MTSEIQFGHANIAMASADLTTNGYLVWDRDVDVFGHGETFPEALRDLADNYPETHQPEAQE